jgi:hypothetical protein
VGLVTDACLSETGSDDFCLHLDKTLLLRYQMGFK